MDVHDIADGIAATIKADGAELTSLCGPDGTEYLWQAAPVWPRHAPVLFPIVGRLKDDTLHHQGRSFRLTQHGFARDRRFEWMERTSTVARLELYDDPTTRALFPFPFRFEVAYEVEGDTLTQTFSVTNFGYDTMPASFGAHPAFIWPLAPGVPKNAHTITFDADEPEPIRRLSDGLLLPEPARTPIAGRMLHLDEDLFAADAVILDHPASRSATYAAPGTASITVAWEGLPQLGIWSKPADFVCADFVCIEPWHGFASPRDFDGEILDKPGMMLLEPGETRSAFLSITISSNPD